MNIELLPDNSFVLPNGENIESVKKLIDTVINLIVENSSQAQNRTAIPTPEEFALTNFSYEGLTNEEIVKELQYIINGSMNPLSSSYIGHMDSIPTLISCLGEFVSTSLNNNLLSLEMSPVFSQMEVEVLKHIASLFGYDDHSGGVMTSGGSLANLQALTVARNKKLNVKKYGLIALTKQPVILVSEDSHTSIIKVASVIGIGSLNVVPVEVNSKSQMDVVDLEAKIKHLKQDGKYPFAVVATAGTTVTGNIDPIESIFEVANKYDLWLHVDAAYAGALVFSKDKRQLLKGINRADSITFNPQKWMYVAKTCAMVLFKDLELLEKEFRISAPYMNETDFTNLGEISVQGTRHADILKLYLSIQHIGLRGYDNLIKESYKLVDYFLYEIKQRSFLELASVPETNLICFRGKPSQLDETKWDDWNLELQQFLLKEINTFLSLPSYKGNRWLRTVLLNPLINEDIIKELFAKVDEFYMNSNS
ncbi:pyridoxal phosphate-dependent decarboxylase family protein [Aquibacillus kalidii]|uniref:pyridoxal phosphate-dependent decarboxylase family protein n=1 Tax=Aquibacillus kalidii TaxID=2762597 RepID=UPI0016495050|nr:aminotransferase class V-fold PLP-dependent enzyme [Aquibacillus kalidii]